MMGLSTGHQLTRNINQKSVKKAVEGTGHRVGPISTTWVFLTLLLLSCVTLGRYVTSPNLSFPICKVERITIPISELL